MVRKLTQKILEIFCLSVQRLCANMPSGPRIRFGEKLRVIRGKKNEQALAKVMEVVTGAVWMNFHTLPHAVYAFEVRLEEGYGARWVLNDVENQAAAECMFRGFLEPQMANGHEVGWRH
eukprot:Rmarinus@m.29138